MLQAESLSKMKKHVKICIVVLQDYDKYLVFLCENGLPSQRYCPMINQQVSFYIFQ